MNRQLKILLVILGALCVATAFMFSLPYIQAWKNRDREFAFKKIEEIRRIKFRDSEGHVSEFTLKGGNWILNDKFGVRKQTFTQMLEAIRDVKVDYPVPRAAHNNVIKEMMSTYIKVEIYTDGDKPERSYFIGGKTPNDLGTYMLMELNGEMSENPYVASLPGEQGYVSGFFLADPALWRSREIFTYDPAFIREIEVQYSRKPEGSFRISNNGRDSISIQPLAGTPAIALKPDQARLREYLTYYSEGFAENFVNEYIGIDSFLHVTPYCTIQVTDLSGNKNKVKIWNKPLDERSKTFIDDYGQPLTYDMDKFFGAINNDKDFVLIQFYVFGKYFKKYSQFFPQPAQANP